jgi:hypothetical protein
MNIIYLTFAASFVAAAISWHEEDESKLLGSWTDGDIRVAVYEEKADAKWPNKLIVETDGKTIRKWGRWEDNSFYGAAIGTMPNNMSGESELVSAVNARGRMTCHYLFAHGIPQDLELNYEMDFSKKH